MHGVHIAMDLIHAASLAGDVKKANVEVGSIANITVEDLKKQLENLSEFDFDVSEIKSEVKCSCGYNGEPKIIERQHDVVLFECPSCKAKPEVISGDKVVLKSIEV